MSEQDQFFVDKSRKLIEIKGKDAKKFLQGILTNDVELSISSIIYSGILTPQGKYLFDFFVWGLDQETFLIDIDLARVDDLKKILGMYRLRSNVLISDLEREVIVGLGKSSSVGFRDPRNPQLGWRNLENKRSETSNPELLENILLESERRRIQFAIPKYGYELIPNESYILEMGFERLNGVSLTKGCFVGQEATARMKHKATLKNGLVRFRNAPNCAEERKKIINEKGTAVGFLSSSVDGLGLGTIKFLYAKGKLICENHELELLESIDGSVGV